jgi:hypothetical protein
MPETTSSVRESALEAAQGAFPMDAHKLREKEKIRARKAQRVTYDLPPELRARLKAVAQKEGVPASQLAALALLRFLKDYDAGTLDLPALRQPSRSPRYAWNLILPESMRIFMQSPKKE